MKRKMKWVAAALLALGCGAAGAAQKVVWPALLVHLHDAGHAYLVDPASDQVVADLATVKGGALGSTTPDGRKVYVGGSAEGQREVVVIDLAARKVTGRIETGNRPKHPQVSPDGKWVAVNHWGLDGGKLAVAFIDTATDQVAHRIAWNVPNPTSTALASMHNAWSADSRYLFTLDRITNALVVIDTRNWTATAHPVDSAPHYPVPSPDGRELWLVLEGSEKSPPGIVIYDLTKPGMPEKTRLAMPLIGEEAVEAHHGNFTQDGKLFLALNRGPGKQLLGREVDIFDAKTKQLVRRLTTASNGIGHTYNTPDGKYEVVTNYGNNVVSIIDVAKRDVVKDLTIGTGRMGHVAFTRDGHFGYVSNAKDGALYKIDMRKLEVVKEIVTNGTPGAGQVLNVWTNVFEELPR